MKKMRMKFMRGASSAAVTIMVVLAVLASMMSVIVTATPLSAERTGEQKADTSGITVMLNGGLNVVCLGNTPDDIIDALLGGGITPSNVQFTGTDCSGGTFSGGTGIIGLEDGIILSNGNINNVIGPNVNDAITGLNGLAGDADLNALIPGYPTHDATVLEFDFVPTTNVLTFHFVFASDEYNEYANTQFNDVFGFFLNGHAVENNIALIPGTTTPVSINNVNGGNPIGTNPSHSEFYNNNDLSDGGGSFNTEMDGFTTVFTVIVYVNPGVTNHIKLAIADAGDDVLDSSVFIQGFQSPLLTLTPLDATNYAGEKHELTAKLVDPNGGPIPNVVTTFTVTGANSASGTATTDLGGVATWSYIGKKIGLDTIVATATPPGGKLITSNPAYKTWEEPPYIPVIIDIQPGCSLNTISPKYLFIPVAILGTSTFDVKNVDRMSLTFGPTGTEAKVVMTYFSDVNRDGRLDLCCYFWTMNTHFKNGDTQGVLEGKVLDGKMIKGTDSVKVVPW